MLIREVITFALNRFSATAVRSAGNIEHGEKHKCNFREGVHAGGPASFIKLIVVVGELDFRRPESILLKRVTSMPFPTSRA